MKRVSAGSRNFASHNELGTNRRKRPSKEEYAFFFCNTTIHTPVNNLGSVLMKCLCCTTFLLLQEKNLEVSDTDCTPAEWTRDPEAERLIDPSLYRPRRSGVAGGMAKF